MSTSPTSGAFPIVLGPSPSIAATICLVTAFFDPRTQMSPRSGPDGSTCQVSVTLTTVGARPEGLVQNRYLTGRSSAARAGAGAGAAVGSRACRCRPVPQYAAPSTKMAPMVQPSGQV